MNFTVQYQEFSEVRRQWLTIVFVYNSGLWQFIKHMPRITKWIFHRDPEGVLGRVIVTQGKVDNRAEPAVCNKCGAPQAFDPQVGLYCTKYCWTKVRNAA